LIGASFSIAAVVQARETTKTILYYYLLKEAIPTTFGVGKVGREPNNTTVLPRKRY
jgi:hypothetical protein